MEEDENEINKAWFDFYTKEIESADPLTFKKFDEYFLCPCCYLPTLTTREGFEICPVCDWEDDGQDDHNADKILGGPNSDYSLSEARENFKKYLTSYRPTDTYHFERTTMKKIFAGKVIRDLTEVKKKIITEYNLAIFANDRHVRSKHLKNAIGLQKKLNTIED
jgi:hypothetical protein